MSSFKSSFATSMPHPTTRRLRLLGVVATVLALAGLAAAPAGAKGPANAQGFEHGITVDVDGDDYYLAGPPVEEDADALDVPGHYWVQTGPERLVGKHYNTGPFGAAQWWSSDAADGELLYVVSAIIDTWSEDKAAAYADRGYVHYHELVSADDGALHPNKVVWLKHTARTSFTLDGGPHPEFSHEVTPGLDLEFMPNYDTEYVGDEDGH